jgi:hypothetical protein
MDIAEFVAKDPDGATRLLVETQEVMYRLARTDINLFTELVIRDEQTNRPVKQGAIQRRFHKFADIAQRGILWSHIESSKTMTLGVVRPLHMLGNDPNLRIALVSLSANQSKKPLKAVAQYIEAGLRGENPLREIFPKLQPGKQWSEFAITVAREGTIRDPSIQAVGVRGKVLGARLDYVFCDDVLDWENTRTQHSRDEVYNWFQANINSRLTEHGRIIIAGTAWHPDDLMHRLSREDGWHSLRNPVVFPNGKLSWPERWSMDRIKKAKSLGRAEFARSLMVQARDESDQRFSMEWIKRAIEAGDGRVSPTHLKSLPTGYATFTGVDLGARAKKGADPTVLFTIAVHPDGRREVLDAQLGHWTGPEIIARIKDVHRRFFSIVYVENNAAQQFILDFAKGDSAVPVRPFNTSRQKADPHFGIEGMAVEFENGKWIIPSANGQPTNDVVKIWINQMLDFSPSTHTGDALMASWFARQAAMDFAGQKAPGVVETGRIGLLKR